MKKTLRKLIPNRAVNLFKHLPTAVLANLIYGFPSKKMKFIGVTGTDGKTTTTNMIYQILKSAGKKVDMVSTIIAQIGGRKIDTGFHVTNPDPFLLQELIKKSARAGTQIFVLEITSHGLDQYRDWGVSFEVAVVTNITNEHLDYHGTWENYFKAKAKLVENANIAVLNRDEDHYDKLAKLVKGKIITFGQNKDADFNPKTCECELCIPGQYNEMNALAAIAVASVFGVSIEDSIKVLNQFSSLEGRMQEVDNNLGIKIIIDFAHTPNALENALSTLKEQTKGQPAGRQGKLISVFGCAGARDKNKMPLMGEISARLADMTIITAEDPRGEIDKINAQILIGAKKGGGKVGENVILENDREKAIRLAIKLAGKGDTIGIFGKGHEKSMNLDGKSEIPWSDEKAVRKALDEGKN